MRRRRTLPAALLALAAAATSCGTGSSGGRTEVTVWTQLVGSNELAAQRTIVKAIERAHPDLDVTLVRKPSSRAGDNSRLIAAVRGNDAPDLVVTDRFAVPQQAAIGLLRPLDPFLDKDGTAPSSPESPRRAHLRFAVDESTYDGRLYGLPLDAGTRGVFYNKELLREAGIDLERYDPGNGRGPLTIEEMLADADRITKRDGEGRYSRIGMIPWDGQASPTTWAITFGARWFDNDTCSMTLDEPAMTKTLKTIDRWGKRYDYAKTDLFKATYQPPNAPPTQTPFFTGRLGMNVGGNWDVPNFAVNAPDLDWGVTHLPVAEKGDPPVTWAGGFGLALPRNSAEPEAAWRVAKDWAGRPGQRIWARDAHQLPTRKDVLADRSLIESDKDPRVNRAMRFFDVRLEFSKSRAPLPVAGLLWEQLETAQQSILLDDTTPEQAGRELEDRMAAQMDTYCPFTAPEPVESAE